MVLLSDSCKTKFIICSSILSDISSTLSIDIYEQIDFHGLSTRLKFILDQEFGNCVISTIIFKFSV